MVSRRPLIVGAAAVLVLTGALITAPAAAEGDSTESGSAASIDPSAIALDHVRQHVDELGVSASDVSDLVVMSSSTSEHNGVTHVNVNQHFQGLEVFGSQATVNVMPDGSVLHVGNSLVGDLREARSVATEIDAVAAVEAAAEALDLDAPQSLEVISRSRAADQETTISGGGISNEPIPARQGWQPTDNGLRLAWQLVIDDVSGDHLWNATVDAASGELLGADDWVDSTSYEDLESTLGRTGTAQSSVAADLEAGRTVWESANPLNDGSSYRAYPLESPNDADRVLFTNPVDGTASPFGWHDIDGAAGAEFTVTRGNNVRAYLDEDADDSPDFGGQPDGGPGLAFDSPIDLNEHPQNYRDATTENLFFWCNTIHDLWYLYGFDEASGNFQANNYGRGPAEGANDDVRCQAQSGAGTNNANFRTPVDGSTTSFPRMRMYLWPGNQFGNQNQVVVDGLGTFGAGYARVTPAPTQAGLSGLTFVYGGSGCKANRYPKELPGTAWAAVLDGHSELPIECDNVERIQVAEELGASAVVIAQGSDNNPRIIGGNQSFPNPDPPPNNVTIQDGSLADYRPNIPAVSVGVDNGEIIKAAIADGPTTGAVRKHPDHPGIRDGDLDVGVVFHEYGHGLSNRLTGGRTVNCLSGVEQMGEGWSDYVAISALIDPAVDDPDATRGMGTYVIFQDDRSAGGIRNRPYSRTMDIQPFTYNSIKTDSWLNGSTIVAPHQVGHGWAATLWDMTWNLIDRHGFNPNMYEPWDTGGNNLAYQLVLDGMKMQGCFPGFVDGRDGILAADQALTGGENQCILWAAFARRGLGFSAVQGASNNRDDNEEAFDTHPNCHNGFLGRVLDQPTLNTVDAGRVTPMRFDIGEDRGLNILASNSPYSRQVNCETLATEVPGAEFVTPGALPVAARAPGNTGLTSSSSGRYTFPWQTDDSWAGTCREFVLTLDNGEQHRAYFQFA